MNNAMCGKTMENLKNRINVNQLKCTPKSGYMSHKILAII